MKKLSPLLLAFMLASMVACGSEDDVVDDVRGETSIRVTIVGNGQVLHSLGPSPNNPCITGTCVWDFTPGSMVTLTETPGAGCVFQDWGLDCAGSGTNPTCPTTGTLTVDRQYDVKATFNCP